MVAPPMDVPRLTFSTTRGPLCPMRHDPHGAICATIRLSLLLRLDRSPAHNSPSERSSCAMRCSSPPLPLTTSCFKPGWPTPMPPSSTSSVGISQPACSEKRIRLSQCQRSLCQPVAGDLARCDRLPCQRIPIPARRLHDMFELLWMTLRYVLYVSLILAVSMRRARSLTQRFSKASPSFFAASHNNPGSLRSSLGSPGPPVEALFADSRFSTKWCTDCGLRPSLCRKSTRVAFRDHLLHGP